MFLFRLKLHWQEHHTFSKEKCRLGLLMYCVEIVGIKLPFLEHPFKMLHPFLDNVTETILHIFRLLFLHFCNLYEVERLTRFGIGRKSNNCITCKRFSSNFLLLLFINVIKVSLSQFWDISLRLCFKYDIRASKMIKILEYQNTFHSGLSSFKYNRYWNEILIFGDYGDLSFLILSKNGVPSSSLFSRLALTQVFSIFDFFPFSNMNSSIK